MTIPNERDYRHTNPNLVNDANGYVWVKHRDPKINRCDEITGLEEISDKETCLTVATGFLSNEFDSLGLGPGIPGNITPSLWGGGDTYRAHLPVGCSLSTLSQGYLQYGSVHYHTGDSGTTYNTGNHLNLKFCKRTPLVVEATVTTPPPVVEATVTTPPVVEATVVTAVETSESEDEDEDGDNKNMYYQIGGGISLCVFFIILLIILLM
jgi:hypothetical protein